jgi:hypothetical protein
MMVARAQAEMGGEHLLDEAAGTCARFETESSQIAPEHHGKRAIIRDQRTRPVSKIDNLTKSAKPPSPVQIRTAPPKFIRKLETRPQAGTAIGLDCAPIVPTFAARTLGRFGGQALFTVCCWRDWM